MLVVWGFLKNESLKYISVYFQKFDIPRKHGALILLSHIIWNARNIGLFFLVVLGMTMVQAVPLL